MLVKRYMLPNQGIRRKDTRSILPMKRFRSTKGFMDLTFFYLLCGSLGANAEVTEPPVNATNDSGCTVAATYSPFYDPDDMRREAAYRVGNLLCGQGEEDVFRVAEFTADTFAIHVTTIAMGCQTLPTGGSINTPADVILAETEVWLTAFAEELELESAGCSEMLCQNFTDSFVSVQDEVFLAAVNYVISTVEPFSADPVDKLQQAYSFKLYIEEAVDIVLAERLHTAIAEKEDRGCITFEVETSAEAPSSAV